MSVSGENYNKMAELSSNHFLIASNKLRGKNVIESWR